MTITISSDIRLRAKRLRVVSWSMLVLIFASLGAGTWFFINASSLSLSDDLRQAESRAQQIDILRAREKAVGSLLDRLRIELQAELQNPATPGRGAMAKRLEEQTAQTEHDLSLNRKSIDDIASKQAQDAKVPAVISTQFINTVLTRVLVVILLGYLVQLLAGQYKYALRMASHLDSTADAIELHLSGGASLDLVTLIKALSPSGVDFTGKSELQLSLLTEMLKNAGSK